MTSVGNSDITNHRPAKLYNLDVIVAVGYRVKSKRWILFRELAAAVLRDYLIKGYSLSLDGGIVIFVLQVRYKLRIYKEVVYLFILSDKYVFSKITLCGSSLREG